MGIGGLDIQLFDLKCLLPWLGVRWSQLLAYPLPDGLFGKRIISMDRKAFFG